MKMLIRKKKINKKIINSPYQSANFVVLCVILSYLKAQHELPKSWCAGLIYHSYWMKAEAPGSSCTSPKPG